jgi:hypothetical protein
MALNLAASAGTIAASDASGPLPGSGTPVIHYRGSFAQVNAVLATLTLTLANAGPYALTLDIWDQGGIHSLKTLTTTIS